jgi:hypothetical protein
MHTGKLVLLIIIACSSVCCYGQRRSSHHHAPWARINGPVFQAHGYPYHSVGIKLGDPFALSYKFFASQKVSVALDFGKPSSGLYDRYFRDKFMMYSAADTFQSKSASVSYLTHKIKSDLTGEAKFLYHVDAPSISPGLQLYFGMGWAWRNTRLHYNYLYKNVNEQSIGSFDRRRLTMGPVLVAGLEYAYFHIPLVAFIECEYFTDIQVDPGWNRFEGGIGFRYIF